MEQSEIRSLFLDDKRQAHFSSFTATRARAMCIREGVKHAPVRSACLVKDRYSISSSSTLFGYAVVSIFTPNNSSRRIPAIVCDVKTQNTVNTKIILREFPKS